LGAAVWLVIGSLLSFVVGEPMDYPMSWPPTHIVS
jgi:hypothetical protein